MHIEPTEAKRRPINLTIREDYLKTAKALKLNTSKAAEAGIAAAIRKAQEAQWLTENKEAIEAYNRRIKEKGTSLRPHWAKPLDGNGTV